VIGRLRILASLILVLTGWLLAWPWMRVRAEHEVVQGRIVDAWALPAAQGLMRVTVLFEFPVKGSKPRVVTLGIHQADRLYRAQPDPLLPQPEALTRIDNLLDHPQRSVFYQANDPEGTAFILADPLDRPSRRYAIGLVLAAVGFCGLVFGRRKQEHA
jgi:hypothetical protein